jgi:uncharacterized protein (TIGR03437 family)
VCALAAAGPVLQAQAPTVTSVVNAASQDNRLSPGCVAIVNGSNLGIGNADVTVGGMPAAVIIGNPSQMSIQIPFELPADSTTLVVQLRGRGSASFPITLTELSPGLESADTSGQGIGTFTLPNNAFVTATTPSIPTQTITLYATGLGATNPAVPSGTPNTGAPTVATPAVTVAGQNAQVVSSGLSAVIFGYYEVRFLVPSGLPPGNAPVQLKIGDQTSNTVMLPVGKPTPLILNVVNGASLGAANAVAPGEMIAINGGNMGNADLVNLFPATSAQGVSVTINNIPVPLVHMLPSASRVYAVVPAEIPDAGTATVVVTNASGTGSFAVRITQAAPGIYRIDDPARPARKNALATFANTSWRVMPLSTATALGIPNNCKAPDFDPTQMCGQPATAGDEIVLAVSGLGKVTVNGDPKNGPLATGMTAPADGSAIYRALLQPVVTVGGVPAPVEFSILTPGSGWQYQIGFQIPRSAPVGDDVPVVVTIPNQGSDTATLAISK